MQNEKLENILENEYWSLFENEKKLEPLVFSNGKTQASIVKEVVDLIKFGKKVIFIHGVCGTGKSAIALNIARSLESASIVVPIKSLQKQYEEEYKDKKYVLKKNGERMNISMITGRENHDSLIEPGVSCADPFLPDTIKITDKNKKKIEEYYEKNPFITNKNMPDIFQIKRISIAPANPYWSPILPAEIELNQLKDARKKKYRAMNGEEFIFYHRKTGCGYYDQYEAYIDSDVIIFNSSKYMTEVGMGRKPETAVEIIDEADEFLDSFSNSFDVNLARLGNALRIIVPESDKAELTRKKILDLVDLEEKNKRALGVREDEIYPIGETKIAEIIKLFLGDKELEAEIRIDDTSYCNNFLDEIKSFGESFEETYATFRIEEESLHATLVSTSLSKKFNEIVDNNKAIVLMSGTLHSASVLKNIFGVKDFTFVEAETLNQGAIEIVRTGKEADCKYSNFSSGGNSRENYLKALSKAIEKSVKPILVHVNAFSDLPTEDEKFNYGVYNLMTGEDLKNVQKNDKKGTQISLFKAGLKDILFTTKCSRGVDFPGKMCNSVVFTKYPNPNVKDTFWRILQKTHSQYYWDFYKDKARREFLQRIYRAVRSKDDHVFILSPDLRVINAVKDMQRELF